MQNRKQDQMVARLQSLENPTPRQRALLKSIGEKVEGGRRTDALDKAHRG